MANHKSGFNYYAVETDRYQDIKIKRLKKDFGTAGIAVYDYVLCEIYRVKGCFIVWDESTAFDVAEYFGIKESLVHEIINYCGVVGLFDKGLLTRGSILSSCSIQRRYLEWSKLAKRSVIEIPKNLNLLEESNIIPEESNIIPEESIDSSGSLPRSKGKESKGKESNSPPNPLTGDPSDLESKIDYKKILSLYNSICTRLPRAKELSDSRKKIIRSRVKQYSEEKIIEMFSVAAESDFLNGINGNGWTASFDWLMNATNFLKVIEGNYKNLRNHGQTIKATDPRRSAAEGYSVPM